jgi:hypothetical protein
MLYKNETSTHESCELQPLAPTYMCGSEWPMTQPRFQLSTKTTFVSLKDCGSVFVLAARRELASLSIVGVAVRPVIGHVTVHPRGSLVDGRAGVETKIPHQAKKLRWGYPQDGSLGHPCGRERHIDGPLSLPLDTCHLPLFTA